MSGSDVDASQLPSRTPVSQLPRPIAGAASGIHVAMTEPAKIEVPCSSVIDSVSQDEAVRVAAVPRSGSQPQANPNDFFGSAAGVEQTNSDEHEAVAGGCNQNLWHPEPAVPINCDGEAAHRNETCSSHAKSIVQTLPSGRLCGPILCDPSALEALHKRVGWTPGKDHIRPSAAVCERKEVELAMVRDRYLSETDYILQTVFALAAHPCPTSKKITVDRTALRHRQTRRFLPNLFPYDVPDGTRHFIMWYSQWPLEGVDQARVTSDIKSDIVTRIGKRRPFEFVWYQNPKMTVGEIFHVQVFWRTL